MEELNNLIKQLIAQKDPDKKAEIRQKIEVQRQLICDKARTDAIQEINEAMKKAKIV